VRSGFMDDGQMRLIDIDAHWQPLLERLIAAAGFNAPVRVEAI